MDIFLETCLEETAFHDLRMAIRSNSGKCIMHILFVYNLYIGHSLAYTKSWPIAEFLHFFLSFQKTQKFINITFFANLKTFTRVLGV